MNRIRWLAVVMSVALTVFGTRLYDLQVVRHAQFAVQSDNNYQKDAVIRALRGEIRTQDGLLLATNRLAVDLIYVGGEVGSWDKIRYLAGVQPEAMTGEWPRPPDFSKEKEVVLARNIRAENLPALYEFTALQPNLELRERVERIYPQGKLAAHLLGYTREADQDEVQGGSALGDLVGASGLEASLQQTLAGNNGVRRSEVTAAGRPQSDRVIDPGKKGQGVVLTIDSRLQQAAEKALRDALPDINAGRAKYGNPPEALVRGAVIALDPRTGEVLAMASSPTFDPNWFSRTPSPDPKAKATALLSSSLDAVMQNRVVQSYDAGSVFKPTSTLAYIEKWGDKTFTCLPYVRFGGPRYNWHRSGSMGPMDGALAIANSCNTWFYQTAIDAGPVQYSTYLAQRARDLGFGGPSGLELIGEKSGNIPSPQWYESTYKQPYQPGQALSFAIGQDALLVTPAQIARTLATFAMKGQMRPLTVIEKIGGQPMARAQPTRILSDPKNFETVYTGMSLTTTKAGSYSGTAKHILGPDFFPVRTGGKTGTGETALSHTRNYGYTNAWYEGFGPLSSPSFEVVTFFQNGGEGSGPALNAAAKMFAARWCLKLDERHHALPGQTPCMGELNDMHAAYRKQAQVAAQTAAQSTAQAATGQPGTPDPTAAPEQ